MTIKKAIGIGLLGATIIGLVAFGIKTNSFNKENLRPKTLSRSNTPLRVNADDIQPVSLNWLMKKEQPNVTYTQDITSTSTFKSNYENREWNQIGFNTVANRITYKNTNPSTSQRVYDSNEWKNGTGTSTYFYRVIKFTETPTGSIITTLNQRATPIYNNNIILTDIYNNRCITQIRKNNIILDKTEDNLINTDGQIKIYIDQGATSLQINGIDYTSNMTQAINLTNENIFIKTTGTPVGTIGNTFTINYYHTLPNIDPEPVPDADGKVTEIVDIRGLMFQILTMPFTFITQAFNVTFWEGTPYAFNVKSFILSLIAIASILFIIKLFTSGFSVLGNYTGNIQQNRLTRQRIKESKAKTDLANRTDPNRKTIKKE